MIECLICAASEDRHLCYKCTNDTHKKLQTIREAHAATDEVQASQKPLNITGIRSTKPNTQAPGGDARLDFRSSAVDLRRWAAALYGQPLNVDDACTAIQGGLDDIAANGYDGLPWLHRDITRLAAMGRNLEDRPPTITATIACPDPAGDGTPCGGVIQVADGTITECMTCGALWSGLELMRRYKPTGVWAKAKPAAAALGIGVSTLHRWAADGKIDKQDGLFNILST